MKTVFFPTIALILVLLFAVINPVPAAENESSRQVQNSTGTNITGPDYVITDIILPKDESWVEPGMIISPNISIRNTGRDDSVPGTVQISASLGDYPLISRNSTVTPMKGGQEHRITLEYLIPDGIPSKEYPLILSLAPGREQDGIDTKINVVKAPGSLTVRSASPGVKVNSCGCS